MKQSKRNETLLLIGRWTSHIGSIVFDYANSVTIVAGQSGSALLMAVYQSSEAFIRTLFNMIGGVTADLGSRKRIMIATDVLSALVCLVLSFFLRSRTAATIIVLANILLGVVESFNSPTYKAIVREMVAGERIDLYNSASNAGSEVIRIGGPAVALLLVNVIGVRGAMLVDAATYLFSAACECFLSPLLEAAGREKQKKSFFRELAEGFRYLYREKRVFWFVVQSAFINFFLAGYNLLVPYTDVMYAGVFTGFYGKVMITEAVAGLAGSFLNTRLTRRYPENPPWLMLLFIGLMGVFLALIPAVSASGVLLVCLLPFFFAMLSLTIFNIRFMSYVQRQVDPDYLGRVFSIIFTVAICFMPVGSFVFSGVSRTDSLLSFLPVGAGVVLLSAVSAAAYLRAKRRAG